MACDRRQIVTHIDRLCMSSLVNANVHTPKTIFTRLRRRRVYIVSARFQVKKQHHTNQRRNSALGRATRARPSVRSAHTRFSRSRGVNLNPLHTPNKKTTQSDTFFTKCMRGLGVVCLDGCVCGARVCVMGSFVIRYKSNK